MKSKWFAYAASLVLTASIVAASMFLPRALLQRQESGMLGTDNNQGVSRYQSRLFPRVSSTPTPSPSASPSNAPTAHPSGISLEELTEKVHLLESPGDAKTYQREPVEGEMTMKQAVKSSIEQIQEYMKAGAMLTLENFPSDYQVNATLNTIRSKTAGTLSYWNISLVTNSEWSDANGGISLTMDAETGAILSYKMSVNTQESPDPSVGVTYIASTLGLEGSVLEYVPKESKSNNATWVCRDKDLFITLSCYNSSGTSAMSMNMSTQFIER